MEGRETPTGTSAQRYFSARARRYRRAMEQLPGARALDLIPYVQALHGLDLAPDDVVLDAFGGTGFLGDSLTLGGAKVVIADCTPAMVEGARRPNTEFVQATGDFDRLADRLAGRCAAVLSHGGLHHALVSSPDGVDEAASRARQLRMVLNLARCLRPGGRLIIADIPAAGQGVGPVGDLDLDVAPLIAATATPSVATVIAILAERELEVLSVRAVDAWARSRVPAPPTQVPASFFDQFVARETPLGHEASYIDFVSIERSLTYAGFRTTMALDYRAPWAFTTPEQAGWFFREMFAFGVEEASSTMSREPLSPAALSLLGASHASGIYLINWGVQYLAVAAL